MRRESLCQPRSSCRSWASRSSRARSRSGSRPRAKPVSEFEPLLEINTDKVDTEVPSPARGTLLKVYVPEGQTVRAGTLLAMVGQPGESLPAEAPAAAAGARRRGRAQAGCHRRAQVGGQAGTARLGFISPVVARIAAEHDVDLTKIRARVRAGG